MSNNSTKDHLSFDHLGKIITIEYNNWSPLSNGDILVRIKDISEEKESICYGAIVIKEADERTSFLSLNVSYRETLYSINRIPNTPNKKEKLSDREIIIARSIDKILRPLLGKYGKAIYLNLNLLQYSSKVDPLFIAGVSAIFLLRKIFPIEVGICRLSLTGDKITYFPSLIDLKNSDLDLLIASHKSKIYSLEYSSTFSPKLIEVINKSLKVNDKLISFLTKVEPYNNIHELSLSTEEKNKIKEIFKKEENKQLALKKIEDFKYPFEEVRKVISGLLIDEKRENNRGEEEVREISCESNILSNTHGSALFSRGKTKVLSVVTLGGDNDKLSYREIVEENIKQIFQYNFHGFSVGETKEHSTSKREKGHSELVRKAIYPSITNKELNCRVVCEVLSSSGSSSMAAVCSSSLSLYLAGIVKDLTAGIGIGYYSKGNKNKIMVDITGEEDKYSEIDLKIAATSKGITAIQMDSKSYISYEYLIKSIDLALIKIKEILNHMDQKKISSDSITLQIPEDKIGLIIGKNGQTIKSLSQQTNSKIIMSQNGSLFIKGGNIELCKKLVEETLQKGTKSS